MNLCDQILQADDIDSKVLVIPKWKCSILVQGVTARVRNEITNSSMIKDERLDPDKFTMLYFIKSVRDPDTKKLLFNPAKYEKLLDKSGMIVDDINDVVRDVNGIGTHGVEEQIKNSDSVIPKG